MHRVRRGSGGARVHAMIAPHCARWWAVAFWCVAFAAYAGQPLVTDDAALGPSKSCQLEAWVLSTSDLRAYGAQPACNVTANLELSVGGARIRPDDGETSSILQIQAKAVLFSRDDVAWSFGVVGGALRDTGEEHGRTAFQVGYAKGLASWYPRDDLEIDLNLGAAHGYRSGNFVLAGAALQYSPREDLQWLAEVFRDEPGRGKFQVGLRYLAVPDRFEVFLSYGNRFHGSSNDGWLVAGIRLQTAPFLP
jgi:hypothetical protein